MVDRSKFILKPALLQAGQFQLPQPFFAGNVLQPLTTLVALCWTCPSLSASSFYYPTHNTGFQMSSPQSWITSQTKTPQLPLASCSASYSMHWTRWGSCHPSSPVCPHQQPCPPAYQLVPQFAGPLSPTYSATILQVWWKRNDERLYPSFAKVKGCNAHCPPLVHSTSPLTTESSAGGQP